MVSQNVSGISFFTVILIPGRVLRHFSELQCCTQSQKSKHMALYTFRDRSDSVSSDTGISFFCCKEAPEDGMVCTDVCLKVNERACEHAINNLE